MASEGEKGRAEMRGRPEKNNFKLCAVHKRLKRCWMDKGGVTRRTEDRVNGRKKRKI